MSQSVLVSAGVKVTVSTQAVSPIPTPTTVPLLFIATRANKQAPDGSGIARGTAESNVFRIFTSQADLLQNYGDIVFVTSDGEPVHGDETNEYGLITAYTVCGITSIVCVVRADVDLGQLVPTTVQPVLPPADFTYWINTTQVVGGIFTWNGTTWNAVTFHVYTVAPITTDGANGDWAFDYSTLNGTIKVKNGGTWRAATSANLTGFAGATNPLFVSSTTPVSPAVGDFWYKTTSSNGGTNLALSRYRASDQAWLTVPITRASVAPSPIANTIWEDTSNIATTANRPLYVGTGAAFIQLNEFVQALAPTTAPADGTFWFNDDLTNFALYVSSGNLWQPVLTTTNSNPTNRQKSITATAPQFPDQDAIWVDISTPLNKDLYPIIKKWSGTAWVDITANVYISGFNPSGGSDSNPIGSAGSTEVLDGSYWVNTGEAITQNLVKEYDITYTAVTVDNTGHAVLTSPAVHWRPDTGGIFGRLSQRDVVVKALKQIIAENHEIRSEVNYYQLISCPGYPETYDDISSLNQDNDQISLGIFDVPKFVIPSGVPVGREITISDWITDVNNVPVTNERGFIGAPDPFQANAYPGGLATNPADGNLVYVPPSYILLRTIAYSDSVSFPWKPPAGPSRGLVTNVSSVGRISDKGVYVPFNMNRAQRDICYTHSINPISNIPNVGLCVWGQKTMAIPGSILDRINVVRLIAKMKYDFMRLMEPFLFELNNATTRRNATIVAQRYLAGLVSLQAIYDYAVLCNETNNTGATIAEHKLIVDVAIKPQISIEFIYVPIQVLNPGDSFPF